MAINLVTKFASLVDEKFKAESKASLMTNQNYDWDGAHTVNVYSVTSVAETDYSRNTTGLGRFGTPSDLSTTVQAMTVTQDKAFTFCIDKLDNDETAQALAAGTALERQLREVTIPGADTYMYGKMTAGAGTKATAKALTADGIVDDIMTANQTLDDNEVPETGRFILVNPTTYKLLKSAKAFDNTEVGADMMKKGVVAYIDGAVVIKVPASRLAAKFGFLVGHPVATVTPTKLADYRINQDPPGLRGDLVEGRTVYDAFVLTNKAKALYYQAIV